MWNESRIKNKWRMGEREIAYTINFLWKSRSMLYNVLCVRQPIINNLFGQLMSHVVFRYIFFCFYFERGKKNQFSFHDCKILNVWFDTEDMNLKIVCNYLINFFTNYYFFILSRSFFPDTFINILKDNYWCK